MHDEQEMIPTHEVVDQVGSALKRLALLHYYYARTLMDELGEEKGRSLAMKAISSYGQHVGALARERTLAKGLEPTPGNYQDDLPDWPWHSEEVMVDGEHRERVHHCPLAAEWLDLGQPAIGRLYCNVDQARILGFNDNFEYVHYCTLLDGSPYCETVVKPVKGE